VEKQGKAAVPEDTPREAWRRDERDRRAVTEVWESRDTARLEHVKELIRPIFRVFSGDENVCQGANNRLKGIQSRLFSGANFSRTKNQFFSIFRTGRTPRKPPPDGTRNIIRATNCAG